MLLSPTPLRMTTTDMSTLQIQRFFEQNSIKHPTALLHFERVLSDYEQSILFLCVYIVARTDKDSNGLYYLTKGLVREATNQTDNNDYTRVSEAVNAIKGNDLAFNFLGEDRLFDNYSAPFIIGKADSKKNGVIAFEVHPRIEKIIKNPKVFAKLNILFLARLYDTKRAYSFYALMRDFLDRGKVSKGKDLEVVLDYFEFRRYLGVADTSYTVFKEFKKSILKPLIDKTNTNTDVFVGYEAIKTGRTLTHLKFIIREIDWQIPLIEREKVENLIRELQRNAEIPFLLSNSTIEPLENTQIEEAISKFTSLKVQRVTVEKALDKFGVDGLEEIFAYYEQQAKIKNKKREEFKADRYAASLLNKGIGVKTTQERQEIAQKKENALQTLQKRRNLVALALQYEVIRLRALEDEEQKFCEIVSSIPPDLENELREKFSETLNHIWKNEFDKRSWRGKGLRAKVVEFLSSELGIAQRSSVVEATEQQKNAYETLKKDFEAQKFNEACLMVAHSDIETTLDRFFPLPKV